MNTILIWIITAAAQALAAAPATCSADVAPPPVHAAYSCHRWTMYSDQSITCEATGAHVVQGAYRFERGSGGLVAVIEQ